MQSVSALLRAVGLEKSGPSTLRASPDDHQVLVGEASSRGGSRDIAAVARATERGILALEEEARYLERSSLEDAHTLLTRWAKDLRRKAKVDEPLASFKAQFLRSNALEKMLEAIRRNEPLRLFLAGDAPVALRDGSLKPETLASEFRSILGFCLPKAATQLLPAIVQAALTGSAECFSTALATVRLLKEDWIEVVQTQCVRNLQAQLDSLAYELQKQPAACRRDPELEEGRHPGVPSERACASDGGGALLKSREHLLALSSLCEALVASHVQAQERSAEARCSLQAMRDDAASPATPNEGCEHGLSREVCERAVAQMCSKTVPGMREGLRLLGLPCEPLQFVPGVELRLRGVDVREDINGMLACWVEDEKGKFFSALQCLREAVADLDSPKASVEFHSGSPSESNRVGADLVAERATIMAEREAILARLGELDGRLLVVDECLGKMSTAASPAECSTTASEISCATPRPVSERVTSNSPKLAPFAVPSSSLTIEANISREAHGNNLLQEFAALAAVAVDTHVADAQRIVERLVGQLQSRRSQLLTSFAVHLEREQLEVLLVSDSGVAVQNAIDGHWRAVLDLSSRVQAALADPGRPGLVDAIVTAHPPPGARCRARWMDGNLYDAEIQGMVDDSNVIVNWLRPRPDSSGDLLTSRPPPMRTVSEFGGDDSDHRQVSRADIYLEGGGLGAGAIALQNAWQLFRTRSAEDLSCVDCGQGGADWALVPFGTFLCRACAEEHPSSRGHTCLVRELADGWGWPCRELECFKRGGNAAYLSCLESYPLVQALPVGERYASRFAEYYRRKLDALCQGIAPPQPLAPDSAIAQSSGEFLSNVEALAVVRQAAQRLEEAVTKSKAASNRQTCQSWPRSM